MTISSRSVTALGTVLVNAKGHTLYVFKPDDRKKVTCLSACVSNWPPVKLPAGEKPVAAGQVKQSLLGSDPDPLGGRVVTYDRWPLYTWYGDSAPGLATGQGLDSDGGRWYVLSPSGKVITKHPASG